MSAAWRPPPQSGRARKASRKTERKRQGLYNGLLPFGVAKGPNALPILDTTPLGCVVATRREIIPADGLHLAFELAAAGQTDREIARALNAAGHLTSGNRGQNPFTKDSVRVLLTNRFYLGELPDGEGGWLPGKHGALIDPALFERAQRQRAANTRRPRRVTGPGRPWSLSGLAVCGSCGKSYVANGTHSGGRALRCYGRAMGNGCDEPQFDEAAVDEQITAILAHFVIPTAEQAQLVALWRHYQRRQPGVETERRRPERRLERLREVYLDGDLDRAAYQAQKAALQAELASLPIVLDDTARVGKRLAALLADIAEAWRLAMPEERNKLARQLFTDVIIENRTVVAVKPRPELLPFFQGVTFACVGGSDGLPSHHCILPPGALIIAEPPQCRPAGKSGRASYQQPRQRKLSEDERRGVRLDASGRSLRDLAAEYGVSHETIRSLLGSKNHA